jgi:hypothetical protein
MIYKTIWGEEQLIVKLAVPNQHNVSILTFKDTFFGFWQDEQRFHHLLRHIHDVVHRHLRGISFDGIEHFESQLQQKGWQLVETPSIQLALPWLLINCEGSFTWVSSIHLHTNQCRVWLEHAGEAAFFKIHIGQ